VAVALVELSVMEQRYQAVMAVIQDGWKVTEVAEHLGVARQSVHNWIARYEAGGLPALADRSHKPQSCAYQIAPELEAMIYAGDAKPSREIAEVEVESVAFVVLDALDLVSDSYSFPYVAQWADGELDKIKDSAGRVVDCATALLTRLEKG
jgi:transposase-like protein